ncbi:MAG TPA: phosphoglucosamine mutase [Methylomirabilota bacterium]|jgi:phosphoglucosamine mutase|nr:phosphoglucosamine mutase [Methylomirabilota bacterium]
MSRELFGTDGIRGVPGTPPLDDRTLYAVGRALGKYLLEREKNPRVLIGMDTRESGPHIARQIVAGLADGGIEFRSAGVITTPGIACLVRLEKFSAGIVLSASHNPYHDNGVKLFAASGMKFPDDVEEKLEAEILQYPESGRAKGLDCTAQPELDEDYLQYLRSRAIPGADLAAVNLVLDCANGAAFSLGPALFRSLGAEVITMNDRPDGRNINADCGSLHPGGLQRMVLKTRATLGVAFDGDADRAMFVSASGRVVDGDGVLLATARFLKSAGLLSGGKIVGTSMANLGLERALAAEGLPLARVPVGDRYVLEEMLRTGCNLGGEQSGHIIFLDDATTGDGLLTALKIACLVALRGPLDDLVHGLKVFPQTIINIPVRSKPPLESLLGVSRVLAEATATLAESGRVVLRYSGTEPKARVMVEAEREQDVARWANALADEIRSAIGS